MAERQHGVRLAAAEVGLESDDRIAPLPANRSSVQVGTRVRPSVA